MELALSLWSRWCSPLFFHIFSKFLFFWKMRLRGTTTAISQATTKKKSVYDVLQSTFKEIHDESLGQGFNFPTAQVYVGELQRSFFAADGWDSSSLNVPFYYNAANGKYVLGDLTPHIQVFFFFPVRAKAESIYKAPCGACSLQHRSIQEVTSPHLSHSSLSHTLWHHLNKLEFNSFAFHFLLHLYSVLLFKLYSTCIHVNSASIMTIYVYKVIKDLSPRPPLVLRHGLKK